MANEFNQFGIPKRYQMQFGLPNQSMNTELGGGGIGSRNIGTGMTGGDMPVTDGGYDWAGLGRTLFGGEDPLGNKSTGVVTGGINAISGLGNLALGYKQYGLAKDELGFQKEQANINNQNQMTTLNNLMRAQADSRKIMGNNPNTALTGEEYVAQHGIRV